MWDKLLIHYGHRVEIAIYGPPEDPVSVTVECIDCHEVLVAAEDYED